MHKIPFPRLDSPGAHPHQMGTKISLILDRLNKQARKSPYFFLPSLTFFISLYTANLALWPYPKSADFDGALSAGLNGFWSRPCRQKTAAFLYSFLIWFLEKGILHY